MNEIKSVSDYLKAIYPYQQRSIASTNRLIPDYPTVLFRGKRQSQQLIAKISGLTSSMTRPISFERERLLYMRRRLGLSDQYTDWDVVTLIQHHGIATRFIDWTSNSLVALWFALGNINSTYDELDASQVYILEAVESDFQIPENEKSPIPEVRGSKTVIFTPKLIDSRIAAQDGYLMRQIYEKDADGNLFMRAVDKNPTFSKRVHKVHITSSNETRKMLREELEYYGYDSIRLIPNDKDWQILSEDCDRLSMFFN
jgi:hypothetical protein